MPAIAQCPKESVLTQRHCVIGAICKGTATLHYLTGVVCVVMLCIEVVCREPRTLTFNALAMHRRHRGEGGREESFIIITYIDCPRPLPRFAVNLAPFAQKVGLLVGSSLIFFLRVSYAFHS